MRRFLLTLKYNGADFVGWQVQKNGLSVQTCLQDALEKLFGFRPNVTGCSRTDSGVHAEGYRATFEADTDKECSRICLALNALLPDSVSVWDCKEVDRDFHPRYNALAKEYIYRLYDSGARDPFLKGLAWHCRGGLDIEKMQAAATPSRFSTLPPRSPRFSEFRPSRSGRACRLFNRGYPKKGSYTAGGSVAPFSFLRFASAYLSSGL